ncbi:MAG: TRAP transporter substrate-binding protein [Reinekea sp.]|jgi:TRAP-type transport system periplasmic protein
MSVKKIIATVAFSVLGISAMAADKPEYTFKLHHLSPPSSTMQSKVLEPWADKIFKESNGRIKIDIYPSMQLGGKPPELYDQVRKGIVDMSWTIAGYTPGRFPNGEVFELPFMPGSAKSTSMALQEYSETEMVKDLKDVHVLALHTHAPGSFHNRNQAVKTAADLKGLKVRAPNKSMGKALANMGASPIFMPVTEMAGALSKGVIDVAILPFEVTNSFKIDELTKYQTEFSGNRGLYAQFFILSMNNKAYNKLPDDLKQVIDNNSGIELAGRIGGFFDIAEEPGREAAIAHGNIFYSLPESEIAAWKAAMQPVTDEWIKKTKNGAEKYKKAADLITKYEKLNGEI